MTPGLAAGDLRPVGGRPPFEVGDHVLVRKLFDRLSCEDDVSKTMPRPRRGDRSYSLFAGLSS
jgi:hypothetical protein